MKILVINSGSSSIKYDLFDSAQSKSIATGFVERIGEAQGRMRHRTLVGSAEPQEVYQEQKIDSHAEGLQLITAWLSQSEVLVDVSQLDGIGHRVVHGGEAFRQPTLIDADVVQGIEAQSNLAPLHNPANLVGIRETLRACPNVPQVAVFDTAFHHNDQPGRHSPKAMMHASAS